MAPPFPYAGYSEDVFKRVRVLFGQHFVADAQTPKLVWEHPYYPYYYFKKADVKEESLENGIITEGGMTYDLVAGSKVAKGAVTVFEEGNLAGYVKIAFEAADAWFEEDERIYVHPRDPYKRVMILPSSKHIRVEIDGVEVANTHSAQRLYETSLPVRSYIPMTDVRLDLMTESTMTTACPYKGTANYFDIHLPSGTKSGLVWWYKHPTLESVAVKGLVAFYDEKVDVWIDNAKQERPVTNFS
ncbi:hypothetical protein K488DRAFT_78655 [Vararia minispora EC-137]|uniref:Uncharacterized protein n=1 Tax=Vararia minispora EC-137 TaxID=1314806 RepID=A0ACB8QKC7_9AGAM|nr:hypothetical protein K488DRAFT_78655 [Vararia minispora EC-137]